MIDLKPCPFCEGNAKVIVPTQSSGLVYAQCLQCGAMSRSFSYPSASQDRHAQAASAWNTRTPIKELAKEVTKLCYKPVNQWINVSERWPAGEEYDSDMLVVIDGSVCQGYRYDNRWVLFMGGTDVDVYDWHNRITHWQPLPSPPSSTINLQSQEDKSTMETPTKVHIKKSSSKIDQKSSENGRGPAEG